MSDERHPAMNLELWLWAALRLENRPVTQRELAARLPFASKTITQALDRLRRRGSAVSMRTQEGFEWKPTATRPDDRRGKRKPR